MAKSERKNNFQPRAESTMMKSTPSCERHSLASKLFHELPLQGSIKNILK